MISIIISTINAAQLLEVSKNINDTISVPYEIISIENIRNPKGICEVYNKGADLAKFDILCFMHEDIRFHTQDWGLAVKAAFDSDIALGLIGVAGSKYKSLTPSSWHCYDINIPNIQAYNILQNYKFKESEQTLEYSNPENATLTQVVCIDGVWMCCKKEAYLFRPFDENLLKQFHGYDVDFSLGINQKYKVAVTFEVLIEHFSEGNFNNIWLKEILKVHKKWNSKLPIDLTNEPLKTLKVYEKRGFKNLLKRMWKEGFTLADIIGVIWASRKSAFMSTKLFLKVNYELVKYVFKGRS